MIVTYNEHKFRALLGRRDCSMNVTALLKFTAVSYRVRQAAMQLRRFTSSHSCLQSALSSRPNFQFIPEMLVITLPFKLQEEGNITFYLINYIFEQQMVL